MRFVRDLRLIPVVALAAGALFLLKVSAIVVEGGYTLIASHVALAQGLGAGVKDNDFDMPPPAALEDTAPAKRGDLGSAESRCGSTCGRKRRDA